MNFSKFLDNEILYVSSSSSLLLFSSVLPEVTSKPWVDLSNYLGRPPILSYASYCLDNWYKINPKKPITLDNVALINNFLGGVDEDWFVTIHVCIEDAAGDAIEAAKKLSTMNKNNSHKDFLNELKKIKKSLKNVNAIFLPSSQIN